MASATVRSMEALKDLKSSGGNPSSLNTGSDKLDADKRIAQMSRRADDLHGGDPLHVLGKEPNPGLPFFQLHLTDIVFSLLVPDNAVVRSKIKFFVVAIAFLRLESFVDLGNRDQRRRSAVGCIFGNAVHRVLVRSVCLYEH